MNDKEFIMNLHGIARNDEEFIVNLFAMTDFFSPVWPCFQIGGKLYHEWHERPTRLPISSRGSAFGVRTHTTWGDFSLSLQKTEEKIWQYLKS